MKRLILCFLAICISLSCSSTDEMDSAQDTTTTTTTPGITIPAASSSVSFGSSSSVETVTFATTADWSISLSETTKASPDWVTVSPMSGAAGSVTITITTTENYTTESRSAKISIYSGVSYSSISIVQMAFTLATSQLDNLAQEEL